MAPHKSVKTRRPRCRTVGVITTLSELRLAGKMARPPELFELRLDHLVNSADIMEERMSILPAPLIMTARHPAEGGANKLSIHQRRKLLLRFLSAAQYVDIELRSATALKSVLDLARKKNVRRIISFHDFKSTPTIRSLCTKARAAQRLGADMFKVATRTDTPAQLQRLLDFAANADARRAVAGRRRIDLALALMGMGRLGGESRLELMRRASVFVYGHVGRTRVSGQPSLSEIRRWALNVER